MSTITQTPLTDPAAPDFPKVNTIVYSRSGQRAKYVCSVLSKFTTEHFVKPEVEFGLPDGEVESSFEGAAIWHEFFLTPPRQVLDKGIAALSAKAEVLRLEVQKLTREHAETKREIEKDLEARAARLARHDQLKQLDDFITKGVACYVVDNIYGEIEVLNFGDTRSEYGGRDSFRLLSLFGNSNGQLDWRLNTYSDGSGSYTECIPCASKDDARAAIAERLNARWEGWRNGTKTNYLSAYVKAAVAHGLPIPEDVAAQIVKDESERKAKNLECAEKALAEAQSNLAKAQEGLPASPSSAPYKPSWA